ncbi:arginine N-succinyltransferase [Aliikangiella coralliicola]|uniref:Arginine N-succinyltransferase n=2 Tax=Aliikangiella coralliicola TaxID=2592383 RepID=A0A545TWK4_9GAMM|nr:arginine N-succinyltransferase [Aliikangiella coralliicola]
MVIRPVKMDDLDDIVALAGRTGTGLTTLPHSRAHLEDKINDSIYAFDKSEGEPSAECYLFVLEDSATGQVVGTSGVVAAVGSTQPFYTYKLNTEVHYSKSMDMYRKLNFLTLTNDFTGASEICTLFLSPDFRGGGNGILLSKCRFLFMAQFPQRFGDRVVAEMRGVSDDSGHSPFWECVGRHFFGVDFETADRENGEGNNQFIAELMPHHPVYVPMLSEAAQAVLGEVHPQTLPAVQMLKAEGLRYTGYVDIFDGGPTIEAPVSEVRTVNESFELEVQIGEIPTQGMTNALVSNTELKSFRACLAKLAPPVEHKITISAEMAEALQVKNGDSIRVRFY